MNADFWDKYLVVENAKNGRGIFTVRTIAPKEKIYQVKGVLMTSEEANAISDQVASNTYRYDEYFYISPMGEIGDYLNHSCEPNAYISKEDGELFVRSIGSIGNNQEITVDYSTILAADDEWTMGCNCGAQSCRGIVGRFKDLSKSLQNYYRENKIVPNYILEIRE